MSSLKQKIAGVLDVPQEVVDVKEWDCQLLVKGLTAGQRGKWNTYVSRFSKDATYDAVNELIIPLLVLTLCDPETKEQVFEDTAEDKAILAGKQLDVLTELFNVATKVSGLGPKVQEEIKETF